jgi:hypothetical protein
MTRGGPLLGIDESRHDTGGDLPEADVRPRPSDVTGDSRLNGITLAGTITMALEVTAEVPRVGRIDRGIRRHLQCRDHCGLLPKSFDIDRCVV